jgi:hypothetical protein
MCQRHTYFQSVKVSLCHWRAIFSLTMPGVSSPPDSPALSAVIFRSLASVVLGLACVEARAETIRWANSKECYSIHTRELQALQAARKACMADRDCNPQLSGRQEYYRIQRMQERWDELGRACHRSRMAELDRQSTDRDRLADARRREADQQQARAQQYAEQESRRNQQITIPMPSYEPSRPIAPGTARQTVIPLPQPTPSAPSRASQNAEMAVAILGAILGRDPEPSSEPDSEVDRIHGTARNEASDLLRGRMPGGGNRVIESIQDRNLNILQIQQQAIERELNAAIRDSESIGSSNPTRSSGGPVLLPTKPPPRPEIALGENPWGGNATQAASLPSNSTPAESAALPVPVPSPNIGPLAGMTSNPWASSPTITQAPAGSVTRSSDRRCEKPESLRLELRVQWTNTKGQRCYAKSNQDRGDAVCCD